MRVTSRIGRFFGFNAADTTLGPKKQEGTFKARAVKKLAKNVVKAVVKYAVKHPGILTSTAASVVLTPSMPPIGAGLIAANIANAATGEQYAPLYASKYAGLAITGLAGTVTERAIALAGTATVKAIDKVVFSSNEEKPMETEETDPSEDTVGDDDFNTKYSEYLQNREDDMDSDSPQSTASPAVKPIANPPIKDAGLPEASTPQQLTANDIRKDAARRKQEELAQQQEAARQQREAEEANRHSEQKEPQTTNGDDIIAYTPKKRITKVKKEIDDQVRKLLPTIYEDFSQSPVEIPYKIRGGKKVIDTKKLFERLAEHLQKQSQEKRTRTLRNRKPAQASVN